MSAKRFKAGLLDVLVDRRGVEIVQIVICIQAPYPEDGAGAKDQRPEPGYR